MTSIRNFSQTNFFHGYRLYAVDGSDIHISTTENTDDEHNKYRYKVNYAVAIHICINFFRSDHVNPSHLEKLIARNKLPVRPDRQDERQTRYNSAMGFNDRLS